MVCRYPGTSSRLPSFLGAEPPVHRTSGWAVGPGQVVHSCQWALKGHLPGAQGRDLLLTEEALEASATFPAADGLHGALTPAALAAVLPPPGESGDESGVLRLAGQKGGQTPGL